MASSPIFYTPGDEPNLKSAAAMARRVYCFFIGNWLGNAAGSFPV